VIKSRRLLAQGYILIRLCSVSSEAELCGQCLMESASLSLRLFVPAAAVPALCSPCPGSRAAGQCPRREAPDAQLPSREHTAAGRDLAASPGETSPLFYPQGGMFGNEKAMKREFMLQGSFSPSLRFRDHPRVEECEKAVSTGRFVLFFVTKSPANPSEGAGYGS